MSTNKKPIAVKAKKSKSLTDRGTLYYTIGTQHIDENNDFFIDDSIVKTGFDNSILQTMAEAGTIVILEGEVLADYKREGFSYIDATNASTNTVRKLKEAEAAKLEIEKRNAELEARLAAIENKTKKPATKTTKGGSNE